MQDLTQEEWGVMLKKLQHSSLPVPPSFISDYNNWLCRSYAGRTLFAMGEYEDALMVLATVLAVQPDLQDKPADGFSQAEHKVLCLLDMVELIMGLAHNPEAALHYMDEVVGICEKFAGTFNVAEPEKIWQRRIELLKLAGRNEEAEAASAKVWQPSAKKKEQQVLDITEVRRRQAQAGGDKSGFLKQVTKDFQLQ